MCATPSERSSRGELVAVRAPPRRSAAAASRLRVSTRSCRPDSGSTSQRSPTSGSSCSRGSWISTAITSWRAASWSSCGRQSRGPRKSETTTITDRAAGRDARCVRAPSRATSARRARDPARAAARAGARAGRGCPGVRGEVDRGPVAEGGDARAGCRDGRAKWPIASATPSATSHFRRSAVPNVIEADVSSSEPRLDGALGDVDPDMRLAGAGGDVPVDQADVVARHVRPHLRELGAVADRPRAVVAREQPVDPPAHRQVELAQERRRESARGRAEPGVRVGAERAGRAHATLLPGEVELRHRDRLEHAVEDRVGVDALGERLVAEHHAVPEHVLGELADVLRQHVAASAQERERACADDEVDRAARAGAVLDVPASSSSPLSPSRRVAERDRERVARDGRVDVDAPRRGLQLRELLDREQLLDDDRVGERALDHGQLVRLVPDSRRATLSMKRSTCASGSG